MTCPYCLQSLTDSTVKTKAGKTEELQECFHCGGHWFPRWLANDINEDAAKNLDAILPKINVAPPKEPRCPICQERLSIIKHDSVAKDIVVWACPNAHGNFFPKGELHKFKKAQEAKITYHKLWGVPIRTVFAVLLPVAAVFALAGGIPLLLNQLEGTQETRTRAGASFTTPIVTPLDESSALLFFSTAAPATSSITLYQNETELYSRPINTTPETSHTIRLTDLDPDQIYTYTIMLTNSEGQVEVSEPIVLDFEPNPTPASEGAPSL